MTSVQGQWWCRLHNWADVIHDDFQTAISHVQQNISTNPFCTAERMLGTVITQNSRLIYACFPIKIDEVWIDRLCVRYDWWRRLQRTSSVSPVWITIMYMGWCQQWRGSLWDWLRLTETETKLFHIACQYKELPFTGWKRLWSLATWLVISDGYIGEVILQYLVEAMASHSKSTKPLPQLKMECILLISSSSTAHQVVEYRHQSWLFGSCGKSWSLIHLQLKTIYWPKASEII